MSERFYAVGAYVIARKLEASEKKTGSGILLVETSSPKIARATVIDRDTHISDGVVDRCSEALRTLDPDDTIIYLVQHAIDIEGDVIAIPAEAIVAIAMPSLPSTEAK